MSGETWWKKRKKEAAGKIEDLIRRIRLRRRRKEKGNESGCGKAAEAPWENPFLAYGRQVMEAVLHRKGMDYRAFRPIVIDTDMPGQHFGEEDDVDQALAQMEQGLNFLEICTDRPQYFTDWKLRMEEEYGLIVRIVPKSGEEPLYGNMVLDFERNQPLHRELFSGGRIYLPFQKRRWEILQQEGIHAPEAGGSPDPAEAENTPEAAENKEKPKEDYLDINVPIGYNRLAVRVKKNDRS